MKIAMNRFRHVASIVKRKRVELPNGFAHYENVADISFVYATLNQSISNQLSSLTASGSSDILIASLDPRLEKYINGTGSEKVSVENGATYEIASVTKDESDALHPFYEVRLHQPEGY